MMAPDAMIEVIGYVLGGVLLGYLLPDVDASDAKVMHGYWKPIGLFGKYIFYKPMTWILRTRSDAYREQHRGYLHSFIGCFLATIYFAIPIAILFLHSTYVQLLPLETTIWVWVVWIGPSLKMLNDWLNLRFRKQLLKVDNRSTSRKLDMLSEAHGHVVLD